MYVLGEKRGWNFPSRHLSDLLVLDRRMIFLPLGHHLCVELCREEGEDSISDFYHCLRDVAFFFTLSTSERTHRENSHYYMVSPGVST